MSSSVAQLDVGDPTGGALGAATAGWEPVVYLNDIPGPAGERHLPLPLKLEASFDGFTLELYAPALRVGGSGRDFQVALRELAATAEALWVEFSGTPDQELHPSAVHARERLRPYFGAPRP
jgi:hypothetical protein